MTLEQMQREGREHFIKEYCVKRPAQEIRWIRSVFLDDVDQIETILCEMDRHTANTWKACLATILESGLLEEKEEHQDWCKLTGELEYSSCGCWKDHNTLARDIKEFISNMDKV